MTIRGSRLLLVEGLPGSGKSTTAQWLCHLLGAQGLETAWYHEQDVLHPVYRDDELQAAAQRGAGGCEVYHAAARERWQALAAAGAMLDRITILESSFLQSPIASMQLACCRDSAIVRHVAETEAILAPLRPVLIVLRHDDAEEVYRYTRTQRGPQFEPFLIERVRATPYGALEGAATPDGIVALLRQYDTMLRSCASRVQIDRIELDVSRTGWAECRRRIASFLDLPIVDPYAQVEAPMLFAGRYREDGSTQELIVAADDRGLFLDPTGTRLLSRGETTFELEGLPVVLTFEGIDTAAERIRCASRLPEIGPMWVRVS